MPVLGYFCLFLCVLLVAGCSGQPPISPSPSPVTAAPQWQVAEVVDGDTVRLIQGTNKETIRIIGIDTPETVSPNEPVGCFGKESTAKAKDLLLGKTVTLTLDPTQDARDRYDRLLAYVEVGDQDFGLLMIAGGFAHEYTYDKPYLRQAQYKAAEADAKARGLGFWSPSTCGGNTGPLPGTATPRAQASPTTAPAATGRGVPPLNRTTCPDTHPIKGNIKDEGDNIYHVKGQSSGYNSTVPEICFATVADAEAAGFRAPKN